tara:strand:- start:736 stop:1053 length:318 start_codon:yes stop_codon:yes gene_type:complete
MNLIIEAYLSEPPSEISCFRDVTLYGKTFIFEDVLVQCQNGTRSIYWDWLKKHGAHDFVSQLIREDERVNGFKIATMKGNYIIDRICCENLPKIITTLNKFQNYL